MCSSYDRIKRLTSKSESEAMNLPLATLAAQLRTGDLSSYELVAACFGSIERENARARAFVQTFEKEALASAKARDVDARNGAAKGVLHGVPVAVKDLIDVKGTVTGFGSKVYMHEPATRDAVVIERLRAAGAIIIGKTQTTEFAFDGRGINEALGTPWNPWDRALHRIPGGSSSGSAVAVACGLVPAALGSDTSGSIRIPAALCGIAGFKPSRRAIPSSGTATLSASFDCLGPMGRRVADIHLLYQAATAREGFSYGQTDRRLVVGVANNCEWQDLSPAIGYIVDEVLHLIREFASDLCPYNLPLSFGAYFDLSERIIGSEAFKQLRHIVMNENLKVDDILRQKIIDGNKLDEDGLSLAYGRRAEEIARFSGSIGNIDVLVLPALASTAMPLQTAMRMNVPLSKYMRPASYLDLSALVIPVGLTGEGLPVGLQFMCERGREGPMFQLAMQVEEALNFQGMNANLSQNSS